MQAQFPNDPGHLHDPGGAACSLCPKASSSLSRDVRRPNIKARELRLEQRRRRNRLQRTSWPGTNPSQAVRHFMPSFYVRVAGPTEGNIVLTEPAPVQASLFPAAPSGDHEPRAYILVPVTSAFPLARRAGRYNCRSKIPLAWRIDANCGVVVVVAGACWIYGFTADQATRQPGRAPGTIAGGEGRVV